MHRYLLPRWDRFDTAMLAVLLVGLGIAVCVFFLSGCGTEPLSLPSKDPTPSSAIISSCDICGSDGVLCTPCCSNCATEVCYTTCRRWPADCGMCEEYAYWDCFMGSCVEQE